MTDHQNLSVRFRGSNIDKPEGQKTEVQNLTVKSLYRNSLALTIAYLMVPQILTLKKCPHYS
jgi:hypothetical protein